VPESNLELVARWAAAFQGDDEEAFLATLHPEVEWHPVEEAHTAFHGHEAAAQIRRQWLSTWADHEGVIVDLAHAGDDVMLCGRLSGRGIASDVEVTIDLFVHFRVRDGRIAYIYEYADRDEALAAAGLPTSNGEIVRRLTEAYNNGEDLYDTYWAEDIIVVPAPGFLDAGTYHGRDGVRAFFDRLRDGLRDVEVVILELEENGDQVRTTVRWQALGETSGAPVQSEWRVVHTMRDGEIARIEFLSPKDPG
jgi:ketosteroid isomerase-like protein